MATNPLLICSQCGVAMNHHCDKLVYTTGTPAVVYADAGTIVEFHTCPECGGGATREV